MGVTNFPDGINAGDAAGNAAALQIGGTAVTASAIVNALIYQSSGKEVSAGTVVVPAGASGTAFAVSGISTVDFVLASPYGDLLGAGTSFVGVIATQASGTVTIRGFCQAGTASLANGTATYLAIGS
jgi:hypothetical protein